MAGQGSARVTLREIDLSQVRNPKELPQGIPAAVVGPARKGPAFVPQTFANMQQFNETFGSMLENKKESNSNLFGPLALNSWMLNAKAGTYLRVLGAGNGLKSDSKGKVTEGGFVVGERQVREKANSTGKLQRNQYANISNDTTASTVARTHMLGCFMKDAPGSRFLCDAGVQAETSRATLAKVFDFSTVVSGDEAQLFLPKELINSVAVTKVTEDVTLTFRFLDDMTADVSTLAKDVIEIDIDGSDNDATDHVVEFLSLNNATSSEDHTDANKYQFSSLSINPNEVFDTPEEVGNDEVTFKLPAGREGDEAFIVQTSGDDGTVIDGTTTNEKVFFSGAAQASPVIRGILMAPQGVIPALNPAHALEAKFSHVSVDGVEATTAQVRKESHDLVYGNAPATDLIGYQVGEVVNQSFKLILNGFTNTNKPAVLDCSFDPDSPAYISKVLNTDPTKIEECGHYLYAYWDVKSSVAIPANDALSKGNALLSANDLNSANYQNMIGFLVAGAGGKNTSSADKPNYESFEDRFKTASTPWFTSQFYSTQTDSEARPSDSSSLWKLFKLYVLDDGEVGNKQYRVLIENLRYVSNTEFGSFDLTLESYGLDPIKGQPVASWKNLNLDPTSRNFIARVIGDKHVYYNFDADENRQKLVEKGSYELKNKLVRVELHNDLVGNNVPTDALPTGFQGHSHLFTKADGNFVESADIAVVNKVFTNAADDGVTETLSQAQVLPLDYVRSINRVVGGALESDDDLAWGVKFALRENSFDSSKELVEQVFNDSISSWAKYYPALDANPARIDGDAAESFQNGLFSLEKIVIPARSLDSDDISSWDGALYERRAHEVAPLTGARYVNVEKDAKAGNIRYLKFRCLFQGGFDGVNIFDKEKAELTGIASLREASDETDSNKFTGPTVISYRRAIDVLSDKSAAEFQLLAIPGQRAPAITNYAIEACEDRFDAMLVMDIVNCDGSGVAIEDDLVRTIVRPTISNFSNRLLNTSFAAAYFPDVLVRRPSDSAPIVVPPSVGMLGVMSRNDSIADPWFAPAGLERGRLINTIDSRVQMNRDLLDELYDADINPVYVPAGRKGEVYAFGQKTLLQDPSALDRINVRRLLIDIRRKVKNIGDQLLFEPNRESTLNKFSALVEPIMADVQKRRGVVRYKVQIDTTTTTQNDVENNTIRGKIYLQPTKSVEFISLDFIVTNTIQN